MTVALPQHRMTVDEYVVWAEGKPGRFELVEGRVISMAPEQASHALTKGRVYRALCEAVEARRVPCQVFPDGMTVRIGKDTARDPDTTVQCGIKVDPDGLALDNPVIVVEVVSRASERKCSDLLLEYFTVPSIRHYLIVHCEKQAVVHHRRNESGSISTRVAYSGEDIDLSPPDVTVAVAALLGPVAAGEVDDERRNPIMTKISWDIRGEGRSWRDEAWDRFELTPGKIEMVDGKLLWSDEDRETLLGLLLENVGADRAVRLGSADVWRAAVAKLGA